MKPWTATDLRKAKRCIAALWFQAPSQPCMDGSSVLSGASHTELHNSQETTQNTAIFFGHHFQSSERALLVTSCFATAFYFHAQHKSGLFFDPCHDSHSHSYIDIYIYAMHLQKSLYTCEIHSGGSIEPHESHTCQPQK